MRVSGHNTFLKEGESLTKLIPPGVINERGSQQEKRAATALEAMSEILDQASQENALLARLTLLQSARRLSEPEDGPVKPNTEFTPTAFAKALCPDWYHDFIESLSAEEVEIFLKNYLHGHETWGHPEGVAMLVRTMLEGIVHAPLKVNVVPLTGEERDIPEGLESRLNRQHPVLGRDLVLGKKFRCRPRRFEILVGPVSSGALSLIQTAGWAEGTHGSSRMAALTRFSQPFYLEATVRFILEVSGFELARAVLGTSRIGIGSHDEVDSIMGSSMQPFSEHQMILM